MNLSEKIFKREPLVIDRENFWSTIMFYTFGQHILNRRITGGIFLSRWKWHPERDNLQDILSILKEPKDLTKYGAFGSCSKLESLDNVKVENFNDASFESCILNFELISKSRKHPRPLLVVFIDVTEIKASYFTYYTIDEKIVLRSGYYLSYKSHNLELGIYLGDVLDDADTWFELVFPRFVNMITNPKPNNTKSLSLVGVEAYSSKYMELKDKYGEDLVKDWPEVTDPQKFVFEDISIASYLLVLWDLERKRQGTTRSQSFIDVGCGNGLLVYILNSEGHPGVGIDVRKRNIWERYPNNTKLIEKTINPTEDDQLEPTDWIIGNHSDEMSPWIPVLAAKNSQNCKFFVLPCCAYEFSGSKFKRRNCKLSVYQDFLNYTEKIANLCGISTQRDRLRIPSTKRICIIGSSRSSFDPQILQQFIEAESSGRFQAREAVERVRNCTQLPRTVTQQIVDIVFKELLNTSVDDGSWNAGGVIDLPEIVEKIPQELLTVLKDECGGLQTLLRNNHQIFQVHNGQVKIRDPRKINEEKRKLKRNFQQSNKKFKEKDCWFFKKHPNGCPLADEECTYRHDRE